ncbi:hypothetical protein HDU67_001029 [Dinochytrium kinnereticum]|nr:hypothetical protein HDU67_001029 [Dinochytrium kinnereticum]
MPKEKAARLFVFADSPERLTTPPSKDPIDPTTPLKTSVDTLPQDPSHQDSLKTIPPLSDSDKTLNESQEEVTLDAAATTDVGTLASDSVRVSEKVSVISPSEPLESLSPTTRPSKIPASLSASAIPHPTRLFKRHNSAPVLLDGCGADKENDVPSRRGVKRGFGLVMAGANQSGLKKVKTVGNEVGGGGMLGRVPLEDITAKVNGKVNGKVKRWDSAVVHVDAILQNEVPEDVSENILQATAPSAGPKDAENRKKSILRSSQLPTNRVADKKKPSSDLSKRSDASSDAVDPASKPSKRAKVEKLIIPTDTTDTLPHPTNLSLPESLKYDEIGEGKIKISCWNIVSLQSSTKKGFERYLEAEDADVVCLCETKTAGRVEGVMEGRYPFQYWSEKDEKTKNSYWAGVAVFSKVEPVKTYMPNASKDLVRLPIKQTYNSEIETLMKELDLTKPVVWTGDLNVAHSVIDLARPQTNQRAAGFTKEERDDFSRILDGGFVDTWRSLHPKEVKGYTYFSFRFQAREKYMGWRLDYFVVSKRLMEKHVHDSIIRSEAWGASDHVPIVLVLKDLKL